MNKGSMLWAGIAALLFCGCSSLWKPGAEELLTGTWKPEGSVAVYQVGFVDGQVQVAGRSGFSGKRLTILDASWDGEVLRFTSYMASTNTRVVHENRLTGPGTMTSAIVENRTGKPRSHTVVWKKVQEAEPEGAVR